MLQPAEPHLPVDLVSVAPAGARSPLTWLTTWRERRFASARCRELLQLHHAVAAREPALTGSALYRRIVAERIGAGDVVRIDGWLIRIDGDEGWHWQSSLSREDSGAGACELVLVCSIRSL